MNRLKNKNYLKKKSLQAQIRRFLFTKNSSKELSKYIGIGKEQI